MLKKARLKQKFTTARHPIRAFKVYWKNCSKLRRIGIILLACAIFWTGVNYGVAQWYIYKHRNDPLVLGTTFVPRYARYYDLEPKEVLHNIIYDLKVKEIRLVSYWDDIERVPGQFDFSELDWQFEMAEAANVKVSLAIGLRQPRWPECHMPNWAMAESKPEWYAHLKGFMGLVIDRYKNSPVLESYQLENEFFMEVFGICTNFDRERLIDEFEFVKQRDPSHPVIISRSNNWVGVPIGKPRPDKFGISVYKRVWDKGLTKRYFEYPLPSWFYAMLAGWGEVLTGKNMMIHELQAEPWVPEKYELKTAPIEEQNKSMNPKRLRERFEYGKATGMKNIDLWGAEWWYWRKVRFNDPSLWNVAKEEFSKNR